MILYLVSKRYAEVYDLQEYAVFIALCNIALTCVRKYHFKYSASSPSAPAKGNGLSKDRFLFKRIFKNPLQSHINGVIINTISIVK